MKPAWSVILALALLAGCGVPSDPKKQAEDLSSIAAEGALLAHDAGAGDTTTPFTRVHSRALGKKLDPLRDAITEARLARIAAEVGRLLDALESDPTDRAGAARVERKLDQAAEAASRIEKSG
jgi:hypothetical protein